MVLVGERGSGIWDLGLGSLSGEIGPVRFLHHSLFSHVADSVSLEVC